MSKSQHTPGPWIVEGGTLFGKDFGYTVSLFDLNPYEENERADDDARLIAAAPDLLELVQLVHGSFVGGNVVTFSEDDIAKFSAALSKATGEST